jgi:4-amino-4-deoxy-L-arabinose transferase-like glycosyltransferase
LDLLVASRVNMVILITLVLIAAFWPACRLLGFWPALIGFLLVAMDPFHTALSRLLHVDGLPSSLGLLSLLLFLNYLYRGRQKSDLVLSGIVAGLAWLTKSPILFLIPFAGLLLLLELAEKWRSRRPLARRELCQALMPLIVWGGMGLAVFVLLWPSMWVEPIHTLRRMLGGMILYAGQGHDSQLYFNGEVYEGDPGGHFYPLTYLWRTTPVVLLGLVLSALALAFPKAGLIPSANRRPLGLLLLFAVLFTIFMTQGAKKFDRYLLPIYPPLDLVGGVGWVVAATWIRQRWLEPTRQVAIPVVLLAAVVGQAACLASNYPYYFSYYNPLLGGTVRAPQVMMVGWGEGLDQAADFLNNQPGANERQVATGVWMTTFSYFYKGTVLSTRFVPGPTTIQDWMDSDYYILYINETQRRKVSRDLIDYFAALKPVYIVRINNLEYVCIYDIRDLPPPDFLNSSRKNQSEES